jgi:GR25 family glycosyltransferase involved in LPS biosynthesis
MVQAKAGSLFQNAMTNFLQNRNAYLINLPDRRDRLRAAEKELSRIGWPIGSGGVSLFSATRFSDAAGFSSPSVRGAFHSHSECLKAGLRQSRDVVLLEDDVTFASCFREILPALASELESLSWDFCYLGHEHTGNVERASSRTKHVSLIPYAGEIIGLHFCMVNHRILPRLVNHLDRVAIGSPGDNDYGPMPVDGALNTFRRTNADVCTLIADPKLGWQRPSRSDITPKLFDRFKLLRPMIALARRVKASIYREGFIRVWKD